MGTAQKAETIRIEIFDPPMCCPSGLCGPTVDPALLDINEAILNLRKEFNGMIVIERYLLTQQGAKFMQTPEVLRLLKMHGVEILPVTTINGEVVKQQAYPSHEEFKSLIGERLSRGH